MREYYDSSIGKYRKTKKLLVCEACYEEIRSRGECGKGKLFYVDEENETESRCDWCDESGFDMLYMI